MSQPAHPPLSRTFVTLRELDQRAVRTAGLVGLAALVLASRIPFASRVLYHWDSVNFAYAIGEFNLAKEQPQPPGYIIYVWLCRLLDLWLHDPQAVMVTISIAASVGAVIAMFFLGEAMYNQRVGWVGAIFMATSPLFWFYNEIALPHTLDAFLVILSALLLYKSMLGERKYVLPAVIVLAIAGGVRQQTLVFLAPLLLFAFRKAGWKLFIGAGITGVVICLLWFIPLISLSGGLDQYMAVMKSFSDRFQQTTSVFMGAGLWGIRRNVTKLILYSAYGWGIFLVAVVFQVFRQAGKFRWRLPEERTIFLGLWILPAVIFYVLIHMGQQGLIFVFLPALILWSASALETLFRDNASSLWVSGLILALVSSLIFLALPEYPLGPGSQRLLTRQTLVNSDRYFLTRFSLIEQNFSPENTLILAGNWHHAQYYLPEYTVIPFNLGAKWEIDEGAPVNNPLDVEEGSPSEWGLQPEDAHVIVFDPALSDYASSPAPVETVQLSQQDSLMIMDFPMQASFYVNADSFGVKEK